MWAVHCVKCGRKTEGEQVFCQLCLEDADKYPVKPGTPIQLPHRAPELPVKKKPGKEKPELKPEERIARLRRRVRWLTLALAAALLAFALSAAAALWLLEQRDAQAGSRIGQNYTVIDGE